MNDLIQHIFISFSIGIGFIILFLALILDQVHDIKILLLAYLDRYIKDKDEIPK